MTIGVTAVAVGALTQCAQQEVKHQLDKSVQDRGELYARELQAQSPFKTVSLTWVEARELMKERNPKYRKAIESKAEAESKNGLVRSFTSEVKKSLRNTATHTLNPKEIAKALNNPVAQLPKQLSSLADLKNISHSLEKKEWERVGQSVDAEKLTRAEIVKLHVLFSKDEILKQQETLLKKYEKLSEENPSILKVVKKRRLSFDMQREAWLNNVRDYFNAEYYDVRLKYQGKKLTFYRGVKNPGFDQWQRWGMLEHSHDLAKQLGAEHEKNKPVVPGMNSLKSGLGIKTMQKNLGATEKQHAELRGDVRSMLKKWRELKQTQTKIAELKSTKINQPTTEKITPKQVEDDFKVYQLLKTELQLASYFWLIDERCWS